MIDQRLNFCTASNNPLTRRYERGCFLMGVVEWLYDLILLALFDACVDPTDPRFTLVAARGSSPVVLRAPSSEPP
ncbi:hypothetical protein BN874_2430007 [Candidatus Contendobacter odensis Run_B_J11]|uniref:Uncharacterized protein n=1 Tax=Candidatus Contendobacter odensis Run_B_J11 TaxID=1400861 RepID=A0A7U7GCC3_9GAMM|nr:hypothetical protein BN874_2430007 [Candidatus Contendobacter odensis Run_B_J11]